MIKRAVFLDRDGTINEDIGDLYTVEKLKFISGALESIAILKKKFLLSIITNQAGLGKWNFTEEDDCLYRKPKTYFVEKAIKKYKLKSQ